MLSLVFSTVTLSFRFLRKKFGAHINRFVGAVGQDESKILFINIMILQDFHLICFPIIFRTKRYFPHFLQIEPLASCFPCDDEQAELEEENEEYVEPDHDESVKKKDLLSGIRLGIRKLFGAARDMTAGLIKSTLSVLKLDIKIFRKYKKRFDKHTDREQVRWWFEIWGDESALKALESKWEEVSAENKWRLETCRPVPPQKC